MPLTFQRLVEEALASLPPEIAKRMDNVEVVIEDEPAEDEIVDLEPGETLFGLYRGIPLTERGNDYAGVLPDQISIYRGPIERACRTNAEIRAEVRTTVIHEIAHHFGIDDERLEDLGW
ncbi:MAG: metallopeptidase family protein [Actinomycetota bacterium]|nr:metallopeptidase family protein [Actinomycetota bacterium]